MALGIDPGATLRFADGAGVVSYHGAVGLPPCRSHDSGFIWNRKRIFRETSRKYMVGFEDAWFGALNPDAETYQWSSNGTELTRSWDLIVSDSLSQLIPANNGKSAIAIDNSLSEDQQDSLLSVCSRAHLTNVDLLWRPVAILLDFLRHPSGHGLKTGNRVLVVDSESSRLEATLLELRMDRGVLVPLRKAFRDEDVVEERWVSKLATKGLSDLLDDDELIQESLLSGEFSSDFLRYRDGEHVDSTWIRRGVRFEPFVLNTKNRTNLFDEIDVEGTDIRDVISAVMTRAKKADVSAVLWHGWIFRNRNDLSDQVNHLMDEGCVSRGAQHYSTCIENGSPTYLEAVPELSIMSEVAGENRHEYFPIIPADEYLGGNTITVTPIDRFSLKKKIAELPIVLKRADWDCPRKVVFDGIPPVPEDTQVVITGEMKPGQGKLKLWIEAKDSDVSLFGDRRRIEINWDTMEDLEMSQYCGPEVYPVQGRLFDENDPDARRILKEVVRAGGPLTKEVTYQGHVVRFNKVLEPWGYNTPWGERLREPTRGLFGSKQVDDKEIETLAVELAEIIESTHSASSPAAVNKRHRFLNYMFRNTPKRFIQELRELYSETNPNIPGWNTAFAPGRVFQTSGDLAVLMKFIIDQSGDNGYPTCPDISYTAKYFWSVFRSLCYYDDPANVDAKLAANVCHCICNYLDARNANGWAPVQGETGNWMRTNIQTAQKSCLCAFLFLTRIRRSSPLFLDYPCKADSVTQRVVSTIESMPTVPFPPSMLADKSLGSLDEFTLRFIRKEVGSKDYEALEGLVTSMT